MQLIVSCFREYSDKKNTNKNLISLAVVFTCNTEHTVQGMQYRAYRCCWIFIGEFFYSGLLLLSFDILLIAPPSLIEIDCSRNNP